MTAEEKIEVAELLGRIHNLPQKQQERIWFVIDGLKLLNEYEKGKAA